MKAVIHQPVCLVLSFPLRSAYHHSNSNVQCSHHADASRAKQSLSDAENALRTVTKEMDDSEEELTRIFDPTWFGREGEFKKLQGTCLEKNTGE